MARAGGGGRARDEQTAAFESPDTVRWTCELGAARTTLEEAISLERAIDGVDEIDR